MKNLCSNLPEPDSAVSLRIIIIFFFHICSLYHHFRKLYFGNSLSFAVYQLLYIVVNNIHGSNFCHCYDVLFLKKKYLMLFLFLFKLFLSL